MLSEWEWNKKNWMQQIRPPRFACDMTETKSVPDSRRRPAPKSRLLGRATGWVSGLDLARRGSRRDPCCRVPLLEGTPDGVRRFPNILEVPVHPFAVGPSAGEKLGHLVRRHLGYCQILFALSLVFRFVYQNFRVSKFWPVILQMFYFV